MKLYPFAIASAAVLGTAAVLVASGTAATENANTTGQQLLINQRISQAAVKRSNSALNYLAPVRTTQSDAANTGANGVTPLSKVTGSGQGWTTAQIANGAITPAKMAGYIKPTRMTAGQTATLLTSGNWTLTAQCAINTGGKDTVTVQMANAQAGASVQGETYQWTNATTGTEGSTAGVNLGAGAAATVGQFSNNATGESAIHVLDGGGMGPDGTSFTAELSMATNLTSLGANGGAGSCTVSGTVNG